MLRLAADREFHGIVPSYFVTIEAKRDCRT